MTHDATSQYFSRYAYSLSDSERGVRFMSTCVLSKSICNWRFSFSMLAIPALSIVSDQLLKYSREGETLWYYRVLASKVSSWLSIEANFPIFENHIHLLKKIFLTIDQMLDVHIALTFTKNDEVTRNSWKRIIFPQRSTSTHAILKMISLHKRTNPSCSKNSEMHSAFRSIVCAFLCKGKVPKKINKHFHYYTWHYLAI